jgi:hypothetical protein
MRKWQLFKELKGTAKKKSRNEHWTRKRGVHLEKLPKIYLNIDYGKVTVLVLAVTIEKFDPAFLCYK